MRRVAMVIDKTRYSNFVIGIDVDLEATPISADVKGYTLFLTIIVKFGRYDTVNFQVIVIAISKYVLSQVGYDAFDVNLS
jgi:hypothetical protein